MATTAGAARPGAADGAGATGAASLGEYLIDRLGALGVRHVFGVPGDFVLRFYDLLAHSELRVINTCDEQGAGFAADIYARMRGLGAVCVTYGVGGLKLVNTTAQAFAERSPVVVISGAPGVRERQVHPLVHHKVREFDTQRKVFDEITVAATVLDDPDTAVQEIDGALAAAQYYKRPVYIELPRDVVGLPAIRRSPPPAIRRESDPAGLREALAEATSRLSAARRPVIIAGVELHRFGLQDAMLAFARATGTPVADTLLGKSVISEQDPLYLGLYQGGMSHEAVRDYVESSDCVLLLGVLLTDLDLGVYTARLDPARCINATFEKLTIAHHTYEHVRFDDFLTGLLAAGLPRRAFDFPRQSQTPAARDSGDGAATERITAGQLFHRLSEFLTPDLVVIADPGDAMFGASELLTCQSGDFFAPAYYASLGYAVPAAIGAQLARPELRPLVIVGDGAFQMTGMELSTAVRFGLTPIVIVLNNAGYVTERFILDGPFNDVTPWDYSKLPAVLGGGLACVVETAAQLDAALQAAREYRDGYYLLDVRLDRLDTSAPLRRLAALLAQQQGR
jgi:indolepyruvate decarboxylase